jgi:hypothetical protein
MVFDGSKITTVPAFPEVGQLPPAPAVPVCAHASDLMDSSPQYFLQIAAPGGELTLLQPRL